MPFTYFRFARPQAKLHKETIPTELKLAGMLFGKQNLRENVSKINAPNPMSIYCENKANQNALGDITLGFSNKLCNEFYPAPVDIGRCLTKNSVHYLNLSEISLQHDIASIDRAHKNAKNTFVISNDVFGAINLGGTKSVPYLVGYHNQIFT